VLVAHTCDSRYSGGTDQEDHGLKPGNTSKEPILKITNTEKGWQSGSSGRAPALASMKPSIQTPVPSPKKKKKKNEMFSG
jgi:hypothetical protein